MHHAGRLLGAPGGMLKAVNLFLPSFRPAGPTRAGCRSRLHPAKGGASLRASLTRDVPNASDSTAAPGPSSASVEAFVSEVAKLSPSPALSSLLSVLVARGETLVAPWERRHGVFPLAIPISESGCAEEDQLSVVTTALLRWPTAPKGMDIPVVRLSKHGVILLAKSPEEMVHRILAEAEYADSPSAQALLDAAGGVGRTLHRAGECVPSKVPSLEVYLMKQVGLFPDVFERLALAHLQRGDTTSALVTAEYYASRKHFPGFGRPFVFNSELMATTGRKKEARDAARIALKSPWWTLGCSYGEVAAAAGWGDEQIEFMRERVGERGTREDLLKGKSNGQVAADQAAFLLDLTAVDGNWDDVRQQLAELYLQAGLLDVARFVQP